MSVGSISATHLGLTFPAFVCVCGGEGRGGGGVRAHFQKAASNQGHK